MYHFLKKKESINWTFPILNWCQSYRTSSPSLDSDELLPFCCTGWKLGLSIAAGSRVNDRWWTAGIYHSWIDQCRRCMPCCCVYSEFQMFRFTAGAKSAGMKRNPSSNCRETYGLIRHTVCMDERHLHVVEPWSMDRQGLEAERKGCDVPTEDLIIWARWNLYLYYRHVSSGLPARLMSAWTISSLKNKDDLLLAALAGWPRATLSGRGASSNCS